MKAVNFVQKRRNYLLGGAVLLPMLYATVILLTSIPARADITYNTACNSGWQLVNTQDDCWACVKNGVQYQCYQRCNQYYCAETGSYTTSCGQVQFLGLGVGCPPQ